MGNFHIFIGTFDMFPCTGVPMIASQPHFYGADPALVRHFESGISPNKEEHAIYMHFEMVRVLIEFIKTVNKFVMFNRRQEHR